MRESWKAGDRVICKAAQRAGTIIAPPVDHIGVDGSRVYVQFDGALCWEVMEINSLLREHPGITAAETMMKEFGIQPPERKVSTLSAAGDFPFEDAAMF